MEKKFIMWLITNQLIDIDTIIEKYIDEDENEIGDMIHDENYENVVEKVCDEVIRKYLDK